MIKDEIKVLGELESAYEKKESEVFDICDSVLKKIYITYKQNIIKRIIDYLLFLKDSSILRQMMLRIEAK